MATPARIVSPSSPTAIPIASQVVTKDPCKFLSSIGLEMVDLYVGESKVHFRVHKAILCRKIPYFSNIFEGNSREAEKGMASFPEDHPGAFDLLIEWVYTGILRRPGKNFELSAPPSLMTCRPIDIYTLADKLCLPQLCDYIMDLLTD